MNMSSSHSVDSEMSQKEAVRGNSKISWKNIP